MKKWPRLSFTLLAAILLFFVVVLSSLSFRPLGGGNVFAQTLGPSQQQLTQIALQNLQAEYNSMISGNSPTEVLIPRFDGQSGQEISSSQRTVSAQTANNKLAKYGIHYTSIDVSLTPLGIRNNGVNLLLDATEQSTFHCTSNDPSAPTQWEQVVPHTFVFQQIQANYQLTYDSTGCDPYGYYLCAPTDASTEPADPVDENGAPINLGPQPTPLDENMALNTPSQPSQRTLFYCDYDSFSAAEYALTWATSRNHAYREYGNDCTNFASQCLRAGGWQYKHCCKNHKDWNRWWYDPQGTQNQGQTRTWTFAEALDYFIPNSGRGRFTLNANDMYFGDIIFIDQFGNGIYDHTMIVTYPAGTWGDTWVSYHTHDTRNRPIADIWRQYPNARLHPYWICHNW
jgi:Putative amidase domain